MAIKLPGADPTSGGASQIRVATDGLDFEKPNLEFFID